MKQYHFRLDDRELNDGIAHELRKQGASMKIVMTDLLARGLLALRAEREREAWAVLAAQGPVANPRRVNYSVQADTAEIAINLIADEEQG